MKTTSTLMCTTQVVVGCLLNDECPKFDTSSCEGDPVFHSERQGMNADKHLVAVPSTLCEPGTCIEGQVDVIESTWCKTLPDRPADSLPTEMSRVWVPQGSVDLGQIVDPVTIRPCIINGLLCLDLSNEIEIANLCPAGDLS